MEDYFRTDLACELVNDEKSNSCAEDVERATQLGFEVERLTITDELSKKYNKPKGYYITVHCGHIWEYDDDSLKELADLLSLELKGMAERLCPDRPIDELEILVVGLGNRSITSDAIGPDTVSRITVTRHLAAADADLFKRLDCCLISAIAPGVLGQTGIETSELVLGAVKSSSPDIVIAVDALAARSCERLATTVQMSDSGIFPGSGIGNKRGELSQRTLGVPVIALGVPTVISSSALVYDALKKANVEKISDSLKEVLENGRNYFVSPKECDVITKSISRLLAASIDDAFGISLGFNA